MRTLYVFFALVCCLLWLDGGQAKRSDDAGAGALGPTIAQRSATEVSVFSGSTRSDQKSAFGSVSVTGRNGRPAAPFRSRCPCCGGTVGSRYGGKGGYGGAGNGGHGAKGGGGGGGGGGNGSPGMPGGSRNYNQP